ncbi:MraY family glycosyltransferase [Cupriavidus basilensis]
MLTLSVGFLVSFLVTTWVVRYAHLHGKFSADKEFDGAQKFHTRAVPRIGGVGIAIALAVQSLVLYLEHAKYAAEFALLAVAAVPAFGAGLLEDLTKQVSPRTRLIATVLAALLTVWLLDARVIRLDIPTIDHWLVFLPLSIALTAIAVAGTANAVNIIDGFNGLAVMVVANMFMSIAYVATQVNDWLVLSVAITMVGAMFGFFAWNFPAGLVFLGDGGAYLIGFVLAEAAVMLVMRNPKVSAWYPVLMLIYPIFETLFSIYRKRMLRGISPGIPDGVHLHMLIYKRLMRWAVGSRDERQRLRRNSLTAPYLWILSLLAVLPASIFWANGMVLCVFVALFVLTYVWLYWRIVRFKVPKWMIIRKSKKAARCSFDIPQHLIRIAPASARHPERPRRTKKPRLAGPF